MKELVISSEILTTVCSFILPLSEVEMTIQSILEELQRDPRPVKNDKRPLRSTGVAVSVAISLLEVQIFFGFTHYHTIFHTVTSLHSTTHNHTIITFSFIRLCINIQMKILFFF
jgi:hypothetical protein